MRSNGIAGRSCVSTGGYLDLEDRIEIPYGSSQVKRRSLPAVCARMACEVLNDAERFVLCVADDLSPVPAQGTSGGKSRYYGQAPPEEGVDGSQESPEAHWFWR